MPQPQSGTIAYPRDHKMLLVCRINDLPMNAMSASHLGAMVPGWVMEINKKNAQIQMVATIGYCPMSWTLIWQGRHPPGFELELWEKDDDEFDDGTMFFFITSNSAEENRNLFDQIKPYLRKLGSVVGEFHGESLEIDREAWDEKLNTLSPLIGKDHPEFFNSAFAYLHGNFKNETSSRETLCQQLESEGVLTRTFETRFGTEPGRLHLTLTGTLDNLEEFEEPGTIPLNTSESLTVSDYYFVPSLELLVAVRMGTLRMGEFSPTAKWK